MWLAALWIFRSAKMQSPNKHFHNFCLNRIRLATKTRSCRNQTLKDSIFYLCVMNIRLICYTLRLMNIDVMDGDDERCHLLRGCDANLKVDWISSNPHFNRIKLIWNGLMLQNLLWRRQSICPISCANECSYSENVPANWLWSLFFQNISSSLTLFVD